MCVCLSLILTHSHPHTRREGAVLSRLDSPLLPPLPERGLYAGDHDDSLSWKGFAEDTYMYVQSHLLYMNVCCTLPHSGVCMCCVSLADLICMHDFSVLELVSLSHLAPSPTKPPPPPPSPFLSLFPGRICVSWKASHRGKSDGLPLQCSWTDSRQQILTRSKGECDEWRVRWSTH